MAEDADSVEERLTITETKTKTIQDGLENMKALCKVLGLSFEQKIEVIGELGDGVDEKTKNDSIEALKSTLWPLERLKQRRFDQIRNLAKELIIEWGDSSEPNNTILKIPQIFTIMDALSSQDVTEAGVLSKTFMDKMLGVRKSLQAAKEEKAKTEYQTVKKELMGYLASSHLLEPTFDPAKKCDTENLPAETERLRDLIKGVKSKLGQRKEIVLRMELLKKAVKKSSTPRPTIETMIERIEVMVAEFESHEGEMLFDGISIQQILENHRNSLSAADPASAAAPPPPSVEVTLTNPRHTRSSGRLDGADLAAHPANIRHPTKRRSNSVHPSVTVPLPPPVNAPQVVHIPDDPNPTHSSSNSSAPGPPPPPVNVMSQTVVDISDNSTQPSNNTASAADLLPPPVIVSEPVVNIPDDVIQK